MKVTSYNTMRRSPQTIQFVMGDRRALDLPWL
jgi:hypothetical protein